MARSITRRRFLQYSVYSTVGGYLVATLGACRRARNREPKLTFLTTAELATTAAACERILPRDEDPGAGDLGVPAYVDRALKDNAQWGEQFRAGLHMLDEESLQRSRKPFHQTSAIGQDNILDDWQDGTPEQAEFFRLLMRLTLEGAFGDPSYGGNNGGQGWRLVGFEPCEPRHHAPA
jgi:gluconate 2-dehydrogenase gamma chain